MDRSWQDRVWSFQRSSGVNPDRGLLGISLRSDLVFLNFVSDFFTMEVIGPQEIENIQQTMHLNFRDLEIDCGGNMRLGWKLNLK